MTVHYAVHIGITPSSKLTGLLRKYHYYRYASSPCVTATLFAKFFSLHTFASMLYSNISSRSLLKKRAGISWRICLVAPHILTSCMQINIQFSRYCWQSNCRDKIILELVSPKSIQITPPAISVALYALEE